MRDLSDVVARLESVVATTGLLEFNKLVKRVTGDLKNRDPYNMLDDTLCRHLWDEYCCFYQATVDYGDEDFDDLVQSFIDTILDEIGEHSLICMTAYCLEQLNSGFFGDEPEVGTIDTRFISHVCMSKIKRAAGARNLDLLGPERSAVIGAYVFSDSPAFHCFGSDLLAAHMSELIDPDGDLDFIADEVADCYLCDLSEQSDNSALDDFLDHYRDEITEMIKTREVIPALEDVRSELLAELDG